MLITNNKAFSLLEVLVAVTLIALIAASALGLLGYHRKAAGRVEERFSLYNRAAALATELPYLLKELDEQFPGLEKEEEMRDYEGEAGDLKWRARLLRASMVGVPLFFQLRITVYNEVEEVDFVRYLPARG